MTWKEQAACFCVILFCVLVLLLAAAEQRKENTRSVVSPIKVDGTTSGGGPGR